ncbi:unnamed protein product, partial [Phaeothamnion confervicola]
EALAVAAELAGPTTVPRQACSGFLRELAGRRVHAVASGGEHIVAVAGAEGVGESLGRELLRRAAATACSGTGDGSGGVGDPDCVLIVGGSYLRAHRVVLSSRSRRFREMILEESVAGGVRVTGAGGGGGGGGEVLELMLPALRVEVAEALLEYVYTDGVAGGALDGTMPLAADLEAAAKVHGQADAAPPSSATGSGGGSGGSGGDSGPVGVEVPESTIALDFGAALGDPLHADVRFLVEGRPIYAHRAVLAVRSAYFDAMFRCGMREGRHSGGNGVGGGGLVEVVVPGSHATMLRLLLFLYTGHLATTGGAASCAAAAAATAATAAATADTLEDLAVADRYRLADMRRLCESVLRIDDANCVAALEACENAARAAPRLRQAALAHLARRLGAVAVRHGSCRLLRADPRAAEELLVRRRRAAAAAGLALAAARPLSAAAAVTAAAAARPWRKRLADPSFCTDTSFPWGAVAVAMATAALYGKMANAMALGPLIPALNVLFVGGLVLLAFRHLGEAAAADGGCGKKRSGRSRRHGPKGQQSASGRRRGGSGGGGGLYGLFR